MMKLNFQPLPFMRSSHIQTIVSAFRSPGEAVASFSYTITLNDGDSLVCLVSTPTKYTKTAVLVHGLGGSHNSPYMIRMAQNLYQKGIQVVRVNLRGCGLGAGLCKLPYNAATSSDILHVLKKFGPETVLVGFSLGANISLKLMGELGHLASKYVQKCIAVCSPLDLAETVRRICKKRYYFYHQYYLKRVCEQAKPWLKHRVSTLYEFDNTITAPLWGYNNADEYYNAASSIHFLPKIMHETEMIFAKDDPFVDVAILNDLKLSDKVQVLLSKHGGHMGFLGPTEKTYRNFWLDQYLCRSIDQSSASSSFSCSSN